ncbi:LuxR C-terminal-related transcriptional regulator [Streptomyces sp. NPDC058701]|uniref:helix-turn-helix transcriptional regulator n=1 Tax=Streptomyces sp. NPDC058701 TaxID=3346608 RepID=UPI0036490742
MDDHGRQLSTPWPLICRERHLAQFDAQLDRPDKPATTIHGPAGVGKTRLAEAFVQTATRHGYRPLRATGLPENVGMPLSAVAHLFPIDPLEPGDPVAAFAAAANHLARRGVRWVALVDDLQHLDAASEVLLRQLLDAGIIRTVSTVRSDGRNSLSSALDAGERVTRIDLEPMTREQTSELFAAVMGASAQTETLDALFHASGGNILHFREIVTAAVDRGQLTKTDEMWCLGEGALSSTPEILSAIRQRLGRTGPEERRLLELLSLCEPMSLADVRALAHSEQTVTELEERGFIRSVLDGQRVRLSLSHPLHAEVIRTGVTLGDRRSIRMAFVRRLESLGARRKEDPLRITSLRLAATGTADPRLLYQAAAIARHAHDYAGVVSLLTTISAEQRTTGVLLLLGEVQAQSGNHSASEEAFLDAYRQAADDTERMTAVYLHTIQLFWGHQHERALEVSQEPRPGITDPTARKKLLVNEGVLLVLVGRLHEALQKLSPVEQLMHEEGPESTFWLWGAAMRATALSAVGRTRAAAALAGHVHGEHVRLDEENRLSHPGRNLVALTGALAESGQLDEARRVGRSAHAQTSSVKTAVEVWAALNIAHTEWLAGHVAQARHWFSVSSLAARNHGDHMCLSRALSGLAAAQAALGDVPAAVATLKEQERAVSLPFFEPEESLGAAWLRVAQGEPEAARSILRAAADVAREQGHVTSEGLLLTDVARLGDAGSVRDRVVELADVCEGDLAAARAALVSAWASDDASALTGLVPVLDDLGLDLLAAEAAGSAAALLHRGGQGRRAASVMVRGARALARCGDVTTPRLHLAGAFVPLTPRERAVAEMVAAGRTSRDIAASLVVSPRTVQNHVQRAYQKLGVTNRKELKSALGGQDRSKP